MSELYKSTNFQIKLVTQAKEPIRLSLGRCLRRATPSIWQPKKDCKRFAYKVGWLASLANSEWIKYEEYTFSLDAPKGHFPSISRLVGLDFRKVREVEHRVNIFLSRY